MHISPEYVILSSFNKKTIVDVYPKFILLFFKHPPFFSDATWDPRGVSPGGWGGGESLVGGLWCLG
jgi:hypothetical protein